MNKKKNEKGIEEFGEGPIEEIREKADIVLVIGKDTVLKRRGDQHIADSCPFCSSRESLRVDSKKQLFHCTGCGVGGDIFTFVMKEEDISFPEAVRYLAEEFNVDLKYKPSIRKLYDTIYKAMDMIVEINKMGHSLQEALTQVELIAEQGAEKNEELVKEIVKEREDLPF